MKITIPARIDRLRPYKQFHYDHETYTTEDGRTYNRTKKTGKHHPRMGVVLVQEYAGASLISAPDSPVTDVSLTFTLLECPVLSELLDTFVKQFHTDESNTERNHSGLKATVTIEIETE